MDALRFEQRAPAVTASPGRADVACFVGFAARRTDTPVARDVRDWLQSQGWDAIRPSIDSLVDLPVPLESWASFVRHFETGSGDPSTPRAALAASVRSFFAQGGRRCYVVALARGRDNEDFTLATLLPGFPAPAVFDTRESWSALLHLFGLPEVSFVCLPDLPALVAEPRLAVERDDPRMPQPTFLACAPEPAQGVADPPLETAPRATRAGYVTWVRAIAWVRDLLRHRFLRETQLIAGVPLPSSAEPDAERNVFAYLLRGGAFGADDARTAGASESQWIFDRDVASAFVQLVYPWVRSAGAAALPGGVECPDGVLAGILARSALSRGTARSIAGQPLGEVYDLEPPVSRDQLAPCGGAVGAQGISFGERVTLLERSVRALEVRSDVTTCRDANWRAAGVSRLMSAVVRALRIAGEQVTFKPSAPRVWRELRARVESVLRRFRGLGALGGVRESDAFEVRCDRSTMTQADLDAGRLIVDVSFLPANAIERINVLFTMSDGVYVALGDYGAA